MSERSLGGAPSDRPVAGIVLILAVGIAIGVFYNWLGLRSKPRWGLSWVGVEVLTLLDDAPAVTGAGGSGGGGSVLTDETDPMAAFGATSDLPEIPDIGRFVSIDLAALKQYWDADAAFIIDAREDFEYAEGHIPGSVNLPFSTAGMDPVLLESLDTGDRPVVVYCGGGTCEISIRMAEELIFAGHPRVAVYKGGFPEWRDAGYDVTTEEGS